MDCKRYHNTIHDAAVLSAVKIIAVNFGDNLRDTNDFIAHTVIVERNGLATLYVAPCFPLTHRIVPCLYLGIGVDKVLVGSLDKELYLVITSVS